MDFKGWIVKERPELKDQVDGLSHEETQEVFDDLLKKLGEFYIGQDISDLDIWISKRFNVVIPEEKVAGDFEVCRVVQSFGWLKEAIEFQKESAPNGLVLDSKLDDKDVTNPPYIIASATTWDDPYQIQYYATEWDDCEAKNNDLEGFIGNYFNGKYWFMDTREHFATLKIKPEQYKQYIDEEIEEGSIHEDGFIYTDFTQIFDHPVSMNTKMTEENFLRFYGIDPSILTESGAEFTGWCNG